MIRGRPRGGPPPEVTLALSSVTAPRIARRANPANPADTGTEEEPYGWEAREFLRYGRNMETYKFSLLSDPVPRLNS